MQLTLMAKPNETILAELYGWGEVPFDWIAERGAELDDVLLSKGNEPFCMTSEFKGKPGECDYTHIYMFPETPDQTQLAVTKQQRDQMEFQRRGQFRLHHIHDGVECFAFM